MSVDAEGFSIASLHRAGLSRAGPFFFFLEAKTELKGRYSSRLVANLKPAIALALDDDLAAQRAQLDSSNVATSGVCLLSDQGRALLILCAYYISDLWRIGIQAANGRVGPARQ